MRKVVELIFLSILLLSIGSCGKNTNQNDLEKLNLKGEVILIKDIDLNYYFFNEKGFIIKSYYVYDEFKAISNYYYIKNKLSKVVTIIDDADGFGEKIETYNYDNNGILEYKLLNGIKDKEVEYKKTIYFYNGNKLMKDSTIQTVDYGSKIVYFNSFMIKSYTYLDNNISTVKTKSKFRLSDKKLKIIPKDYSIEYSKFINGLEIERENSDGKIKFEYIKDQIGNWISQKSLGATDEFTNTRVVYYKGDDITANEKTYNVIKESILNSNKSIGKITDENIQEQTSEKLEGSNNLVAAQTYNSNQPEEKRKCYSCNGTGKCSKCSKPQRVRYKQGESPHDHNEIRQGMIVCHQCGGNLMDFGSDKNKSCYLCKASGWLNCRECNSNGNGNYIGKCNRCKGTGFDN